MLAHLRRCAVSALGVVLLGVLLAVALLAPVNAASAASQTPEQIAINPNVAIGTCGRTIDLRSNIEQQTIEFAIRNNGKAPVTYFLLPIPAHKAQSVALVRAKQADETMLKVKQLGSSGVIGSVPAPATTHTQEIDALLAQGVAIYKIDLAKPLAEDEQTTVETRIGFVHTMVALPAAIEQADPQFVEYHDYTKVPSLYPIRQQMTQIILPDGSEIESYRPRAGSTRRGKTISYGPYDNTVPIIKAALAKADELYIHFENNFPFATARSLVRDIEVSHWGDMMTFDENYYIEHTGAQLKGGFSRAHYQSRSIREAGRSSFRTLKARLPRESTGIYFRDAIGNISTSTIRYVDRLPPYDDYNPNALTAAVELYASPRYPMFGGWKADLNIGYHVPAHVFLSHSVNDPSQFTLELPFGSPFVDVPIDDYTLRVVLPEGATNIRWESPFEVESFSFSSHITYLDTTGRPVIEFKQKRIVPGHNQPIRVTYSFSSIHLAREPGLLIAAIFAFLVAVMVYVRLDFSFNASTGTGAAAAAAQAAEAADKRKSE